jgi:hypothetical protein
VKVSHVYPKLVGRPGRAVRAASPRRYDQEAKSMEGKDPMKPLRVDEKAVSVGESEDCSAWPLRLARTAGDRRLKEVSTTLPDPQTNGIDLRSIPLLGERE